MVKRMKDSTLNYVVKFAVLQAVKDTCQAKLLNPTVSGSLMQDNEKLWNEANNAQRDLVRNR